MSLRVSVTIPCKQINGYARECIEQCQALDYPDFEILVSPDSEISISLPGVKILPSGAVGPAEKRDLMAIQASGELLAFIDDDAYPVRTWLKEAVKHFEQQQVAAVVGPAVTPGSDSLLQKGSGGVYTSFMGSGTNRFRYIPMGQRTVDDYPSCNFIIRKSVFEQLGGFSTSYWPGEDTKLCMEVTNELHKSIVYDPKVLVYHHRRELFLPHLRQVWSYAVHRGYFAKRFGRTSLRISYFLPSLFVLGAVCGIGLSFLHPAVKLAYVSAIALYAVMVLISSLEQRNVRIAPLVYLGTVLTHVTYGIGFIKGLLTRDLKR